MRRSHIATFSAFALLCAALAACDTPTPTEAPRVASPPAAAPRASAAAAEDDSRPAPAAPVPASPAGTEDAGHYSSLEGEPCRLTEKDEETGGATTRCPGLGGYALDVHDYDARMSIDVVAPGGKTTPLHLWRLDSGGFSSLGQRAEWRFAGGARPTALVVRHNAHEDPEQPEKITSYLIVARLTGQAPCVVARVAPGAEQNVRARAVADRAATAACLPRRD